jgi:hypothetical protein
MRISVMVVAAVLLGPAHYMGAQQTCHRADVNSAAFIKGLNAMMDSSQRAFRAKLKMPLVASSTIALVSDPKICARAGFAADSIFKVWEPTAKLGPTHNPLYVIKIGTSFAVADLNSPSDSDGDWVFIFGPSWEYRGSIAM